MDMKEIEQALAEQLTINRSLIDLTAENDETISHLCQAVGNLTTICTAQQNSLEALIRVNVTMNKEIDKLKTQNMMMGMNN